MIIDGLVVAPDAIPDVIGGLGSNVDLDAFGGMPVQPETAGSGVIRVEAEIFPGGGNLGDPVQ